MKKNYSLLVHSGYVKGLNNHTIKITGMVLFILIVCFNATGLDRNAGSMALRALYNHTHLENWANINEEEKWLNGETEHWHGVETDGIRVTKIDLSGQNLSGSIPPPWERKDIGSGGKPGNAIYNKTDGRFTVIGSGSDIWGKADSFCYVYRPCFGDAEIIARIDSQKNVHPFAKSGIMIRENTSTGSKFAALVIMPYGKIMFQWRPVENEYLHHADISGITPPCWLKINRSGNTFTSYISFGGYIWQQVGVPVTIDMPNDALTGLAVCSHNNVLLGRTMFDHVSLLSDVGEITPVNLTASNIDTASFTLNWNTLEKAVSYDIYKDQMFYESVNVTSVDIKGLDTATTYSMFVKAKDATGRTSVRSKTLPVTTLLHKPWQRKDVGSGFIPGKATYQNGVFKVFGSGTDIWGQSDGFCFVYQPWPKNVEIIARVDSLQKVHPFAKSGIMIRDNSSSSGAKFAALLLGPYGGITFEWRSAENGYIQNTSVNSTFKWVKMVRLGNYFIAYISSDGTNWNRLGSPVTIDMSTNASVGMAVCSHNKELLGSAKFEQVRVANPGGPVMDLDIYPREGCPPFTLTFTNKSKGLVRTYLYFQGSREFTSDTMVVNIDRNWTGSDEIPACYSLRGIDAEGHYLDGSDCNILIHRRHPLALSSYHNGCFLIISYDAFSISNINWGDGVIGDDDGHCYTKSGCYTIKVPWWNNCVENNTVEFTACVEFDDKSAPITPDSTKSIPSLWPNPAHNLINVRVSEQSIVRIMDINSQALFDKPVNPGITQIPFNLPSGFYIIQVIGENNKVYLTKLAVE